MKVVVDNRSVLHGLTGSYEHPAYSSTLHRPSLCRGLSHGPVLNGLGELKCSLGR